MQLPSQARVGSQQAQPIIAISGYSDVGEDTLPSQVPTLLVPLHLTPTSHGQLRTEDIFHVVTSKLFDSESVSFVYDKLIVVHRPSGVILSVNDMPNEFNLASTDIDLRGLTVLPGLIDAHVHFFLHPYAETSWTEQITTESIVERTVRATNHARRTVLAGFTTVRYEACIRILSQELI